MKKLQICLILAIFSIATAFARAPKEVTIEQIVNEAQRLDQERVIFQGIVEKIVPGTAETADFYEIKGNQGGVLRRVNTKIRPIVGNRYEVTGTVVIHNNAPLVVEERRTFLRIDPNTGEIVERYVVVDPPPPSINTLLLIAIIAAGIIILILIIFLISKALLGKGEKQVRESLPKPAVAPKSVGVKGEETVFVNKDAVFSTIKIERAVPATMKALPGKLEILNGPDTGKTFIMPGYPTAEGSIVTIGRDHDGWEKQFSGNKKYAHIRVKDDSKTMSRMQIEIIYKDGKVYLKNLSSVNPTQVDGVDVATNQVVEVKFGSKIKAGYIEFQYSE